MKQAVTLKSACLEAQRRGYQYIRNCEIGLYEYIEDFIEDLEAGSGTSDPADYMIFGDYIVRLSDAGKAIAEVYELLF